MSDGHYPQGKFPPWRILGGATADLLYSESIDQSGATWTEPVAVASGVDANSFGLAHTGGQYIAIYSKQMVPYIKITSNPQDWSGAVETVFSTMGGPATGIIRGACTDEYGIVSVMVLDRYTAPSGDPYWKSYVYASRNLGATWVLVASWSIDAEEAVVATINRTFAVSTNNDLTEYRT